MTNTTPVHRDPPKNRHPLLGALDAGSRIHLPGSRSPLRIRLSALAALVIALGVAAFGIAYGTFAASDTDPYGYVSQADLIAKGTLRIDQSFAREMPWPEATSSYVPPGYTISPDRQFAVPVYAIGLPALMAVAQRLSGERVASFYVVPLLGALTIWATYRLGSRINGPGLGLSAALLLATSAIFLGQVMQPVSDVPATAWWTVALALFLRDTRMSIFSSGLAASMAVLTRPNLVPLAIPLGGYLLFDAVRSSGDGRRHRMVRLALFAFGLAPGCALIGGLNAYFHGSPLRSGYAPLRELFSWSHVLPNLDRYPRWLVDIHSPLILIGIFTPIVLSFMRRGSPAQRPRSDIAWLLLSFVGVAFLLCIFYGYFGRDEWNYLRFFLPALPALLVLCMLLVQSVSLGGVANRARVVLGVLLVGAWGAWQVGKAAALDIVALRDVEHRYVVVGRCVADVLPKEAVVIAGLHSGSIRYYADRQTINYARLDERSLDAAIETLAARGTLPYIVLEDGEMEPFRRRFSAAVSTYAALDWPPSHSAFERVTVHIWEPDEREQYVAAAPVVTWDIGRRDRRVARCK